jgi:hypothetical protein
MKAFGEFVIGLDQEYLTKRTTKKNPGYFLLTMMMVMNEVLLEVHLLTMMMVVSFVFLRPHVQHVFFRHHVKHVLPMMGQQPMIQQHFLEVYLLPTDSPFVCPIFFLNYVLTVGL